MRPCHLRTLLSGVIFKIAFRYSRKRDSYVPERSLFMIPGLRGPFPSIYLKIGPRHMYIGLTLSGYNIANPKGLVQWQPCIKFTKQTCEKRRFCANQPEKCEAALDESFVLYYI